MSAAIPFPHRLAGHCASGAFRDMFEWRGYRDHGAPLSEAMIFGLGAGLDVLYMPAPTRKIPFYLGGRGPRLEESLVERIGGSVIRRSETDEAAAWDWVRDRLDRGEPVMLVGDCQKLDYLKTRTSMPLHVIVATGYDTTHVLVADNDRAEIQRCSHASFRAARSAMGFPLPAMNVTFEIEWPKELPSIDSVIVDALREQIAWLDDPHGPAAMLLGRESFGVPAIARLEADAASWNALDAKSASAFATLLWIYIEKAGTGGGLFRALYRDFLGEAHARLGGAALASAHAHYRGLADEWTSVATQCATGSFDGVPARVVRLAKMEREAIECLRRVVG